MASRTLQSTIEISGVLSPSLQAAIKNAVSKLDEMSKETLESAGAAEKLCAEISTQESVLKSLQKGYADYVVSGKESSEEANTLADKIQELSGELEENKDTLKAAEKAAKRLTDTQDDSADAFTRLERTINGQEDELEELRREYANVVLEQGKTSKEAKSLERKISSLSAELTKNKGKLQDVGEAAEEAGRKAENSGEGYTVLKDAIGDLVADAIEKAVEAFKELATEGDNALSMLEARTGAAGEKMAGFEDVMYEVYNANYGESLGDVSDTLATVIQMTDDLDNASLAQITKNAIALDDVFGFDVTESMRAVNSLMDQFGLTSDQAFNLIVQGAQRGLNQNGDLLDTINEYSVQFKNAGYTADDMFNMLVNGAESGTWSVDKLGDAVKEFNIRASDGTITDAIMENAKAFDMTKKEAENLGKEIEGGSVEAYQKLIDKLKEVDDDAQRYQLGVAMFGTMWEDLGEEAVFALMDTEGAISGTADAMKKLDDAAYDTLEGSFSQLGRTINAEWIQPLVEKLTPVIKNFVDFLTENVSKVNKVIPAIVGLVGAFLLFKKLKSVTGILSGLFGGGAGGGGSGGGSGGILGSFGKMNIGTTLKGLANIGLIVVALGALAALLAWVAPHITSLCSGEQFLKLMAAISITGLVGSALAGLAGLIGSIPIPVVLSGLANIALALGGFALIIEAFGLLSSIPGFNEFLKRGGEVLAEICRIIGEMVGSIIGGIGEGITNSLITIGDNLSAFAVAIEPMVTTFSGLNYEGLKEFAEAFGVFALVMAGDAILGWLTGGTDYAALGKKLTDFARTSSGFFDAVADIPDAAFTAGTNLFNTLANVKALPKEGGVVSWFTGDSTTGLSNVARQLPELGENVAAFYSNLGGITNFAPISSLFNTLASVKALPKEGGVASWFTGDSSTGLSNVARQLPDIGANVAAFFDNLGGVTNFAPISSLFNTLASVKALPKEGGVVSWFTGDSTTGLSNVAVQLPEIGTNVAAFFDNLGGVTNFVPISSLFNTLASVKALPKEGGVTSWFTGDSSTGLSNVARQLPEIGTNVGTFFSNLGGVTDFAPISSLFNALANVKSFPSEGGVASWFTGDSTTGLSNVASQLPEIGTNVGAFFTNLGGVTNFSQISSLFNTLGNVKSLPKEGGVASWFTGDSTTGLTNVARQLPEIGANTAAFFSSLGGITDFSQITSLFNTLGSVKSLPKEGGVASWFTGDSTTGLSNVASQLPAIGTNVAAFFTNLGGITDFSQISSLFNTLGNVNALPKEGGVVSWFTGDSTTGLSNVASQLPGIASNVGAFFTNLGGVTDFSPITSLFNALSNVNAFPSEGGVFSWFTGDSSEGLTNVASQLPAVAASIATFFNNLGGRTDFSPIASLFNTLSSINIDSEAADRGWLSGESQISTMGAELGSFARNASPFFTMINSLNVGNMSNFFAELSTVGALPAALTSMDAAVGTALSAIAITTVAKMTEIREAIETALTSSNSTVTGEMGTIESTMNAKLSSAFNTAADRFGMIYNTIRDKINSARDAVVSAINSMKNAFNFSWSLPHIKMPHLKVTGDWSFDPPTVPKFSVSWYKEGGILTQPTVFGSTGNTLLAGGEAGAEAVLPLAVLWDKMEAILQRILSGENSTGGNSDEGLTSKAGELLTLDNFSLGSLADGTNVVIYYDFSNFTWSPQIQTSGTGDDEDDLMARLRAHEAEFFDWLEEFIQMREVAQYA